MKRSCLAMALALSLAAGIALCVPASLAQDHSSHAGHAPAASSPPPAGPALAAPRPPSVTLSADQVMMLGVRTVPAAVRELTRIIRASGRIEPDERAIAVVTTRYEAWVEKLFADYTGRAVKKGEPLAELYSPEAVAVRLEAGAASRWARQADGQDPPASPDSPAAKARDMTRNDAKALVDAAGTRLALAGAQKPGKSPHTVLLTSPLAGTIVQKTAVAGMRVMPGEKLFEIADLSRVWAVAEIYEYELPGVALGQVAEISVKGLPERTYKAPLEFIAPVVTGETRTVRLRFTLDNPGGELKPLMNVDVELAVRLGKRLAVPDSAVIDTGERRLVYVETAPGVFSMREVETGAKALGLTEIVSGLAAGEKVVYQAAFLVDSETRLSGGGGTGHQH